MTYMLDRTLEEFEGPLPHVAEKVQALDRELSKGHTPVCSHVHADAEADSDSPVRAHLCLAHPGALTCDGCSDYHLSADRRRGDECAECGRNRDNVRLEAAPVTWPRQLPSGRILDLTIDVTLCRLCSARVALGIVQEAG